jgi:hypothetical protein
VKGRLGGDSGRSLGWVFGTGMRDLGVVALAAALALSIARNRRGECAALSGVAAAPLALVFAATAAASGSFPVCGRAGGVFGLCGAPPRRAVRSGAALAGTPGAASSPRYRGTETGGTAASASCGPGPLGSGSAGWSGTATATATARGGRRTASSTSRDTIDPAAAVPVAACETATAAACEAQTAMARIATSPVIWMLSMTQPDGLRPTSSCASTTSTANCALWPLRWWSIGT